ncbi:MAG: zinc-dependent metalloprotease [Saprospiraceae bacterium]|nr:zinc-dependent metalloprotease [Saprospiraceae bacterium]
MSQLAVAQGVISNHWCGTVGRSAWLTDYQNNRNDVQYRSGDSTWLYVPMTVHVVGNDNGNGYYPLDLVFRIVCEMNEQYNDARIRFYLMPGDGVRYVNNTSWYVHDFDGGSELINNNRLPDRVNAFIVADPAGNCGYSWQDAIVMGKGCSNVGNSTWAHEAGHHLSLPHPFVGWEGTSWNFQNPAPDSIDGNAVERVDGSNCYEASDRFCDTRPDYISYRWPCDGNFESQFPLKDPAGEIFRSDATLFMGYSYDECASRFTPEQITAMRANLHTEHAAYLQITEPLGEIADDTMVQLISPIDSVTVQYDQFNLHWNKVPNATYYLVDVSFTKSFAPKMVLETVYNDTMLHITKPIPNNRIMYWRVRAYSEWDVCQHDDNIQLGVFRTRNLSTTSELENVLLADLTPNPVGGGQSATLLIITEESSDAQLQVTDMAGRLCQQRSISLSAGENDLDIPTSSLQAGLYMVTLRNQKGAIIRRLVVAE